MVREKNTSRQPKLPDINKKSDVSRCSKNAVKMVQCAQRAQTNGQHRVSRGRKKTGGPTPVKTVKETSLRPPTKLPDIKLPTRAKINWPIAPDGFIPNSIVRSLAPFPSRSGAVPVKEENEDGLAQSAIYVERLIQKYENTAEEEKKLRKKCAPGTEVAAYGT